MNNFGLSGEAQPYLKPISSSKESKHVSQLRRQAPASKASRISSSVVPPPKVLQFGSSHVLSRRRKNSKHRAFSDHLVDHLAAPSQRSELAYLIVDLQDRTEKMDNAGTGSS